MPHFSLPKAFSQETIRHGLMLIIMLLLCCATVQARHLSGRVVDAKTHEDIPGATVELLSAKDSSVIRTTVTSERKRWDWTYYGFDIDVDNNTSYILRISAIGYKPLYKKVDVKMADRVNVQNVWDIELEEESKVLDEVVVKATKIKMVMKGDTVVYDASAFNLSEGSMLDALVRQMPGATLENGVIKVNGRTVSSLLVDGRDFFNGDAKKALENLPAYTVDKIRVYDKRGKESRLMGRDMGDKDFVLDVGLKKQYQHGWLGNVDVAGGTRHRYSGRLFSMAYTKKTRLTITGLMNNVNDGSVPGQDDVIGDMPDAGGGLTARRSAGLAYRWEGKTEDDYIETNNYYSFTDNDTRTRTNSQTFLTGGDYYNLSRNGNRSKSRSWSSDNNFGWAPKHHMLNLSLSTGYQQGAGWGLGRSGQFNSNPWSTSMLDSLFLPGADQRLLAMAVNRQRNDSKNNSQSINYSAGLMERYAFGKKDNWGNMLFAYGSFRYSHGKNWNYALNQVDYLGDNPSQDHRDQYSTSPDESYNVNASLEYNRIIDLDTAHISNIFIRPFYRFTKAYNSSDYSLFRLDQLEDFTDETYALGVLPSSREALMQVIDAHNSYRSRQHTVRNDVGLDLRYSHGDGTRMPQFEVNVEVPVRFNYETLDYYRERNYDKDRHSTFINPSARMQYHFNDSTGTRYAWFNYSYNRSQPSLVSLLDFSDDANPLVITLGNPNLKNSGVHSASLGMAIFQMETQSVRSFDLNYSITQNAIATSMLYDKSTGRTTTQQVNINGNWSLGGMIHLQRPIDRKKRLTLASHTNINYNNSVDLTTVEGSQSGRSNVHNWNIGENFDLQYQVGDKLRVHGGARAGFQRATSPREDFQTVSAWNYNFSVGGNVQLPLGFEVSTDLTDYNRRGYNDDEMNTSEVVWNARVTKKLLANKLSLSLDAFDILGNLNSTQFTLNSQGRTETWTNSIPRYLMLHASYKFTLGMARPKRNPWD